jgi:hypothetical protein
VETIKLRSAITVEEKATFTTRESERGLILLDMNRDKMYEVNESGSVIIKLIQKGARLEDIIDALFETYEVDMDTLKKDVNEFLKKLKEFNLIS